MFAKYWVGGMQGSKLVHMFRATDAQCRKYGLTLLEL